MNYDNEDNLQYTLYKSIVNNYSIILIKRKLYIVLIRII